MKNQPAATGCGVDCLSEAFEADSLLLQGGDRINQVPQRPSQPVKPPDNKGIATTQVGECLFKPRPAGFGPADVISKDSAASCLFKGITLGIKVLFIS